MNKTFRIVWSAIRNAFIVTHEKAKSFGKPSSTRSAVATGLVASLLAGSGFVLAAPPVNQLPTGGQIVGGNAAGTIATNGNAMTINQVQQRIVANWDSYSIGQNASVHYQQPTGGVALNRVTGTAPSEIYGRLTATGDVYLINPNGVMFGRTAQVDVGALVASTSNISDADFFAGKAKFNRNGATGKIENEGQLTAALGGYIALLAPEVRNSGVILAQMGTVALAAGEAVELQFDSGKLANLRVDPATIATLIDNKNAVVAPGGLIILSAQAASQLQGGAIKNSGTLDASGMTVKGGRIVLEASHTIDNTGTISAAGNTANAGGSVAITAPQVNLGGTVDVSGSTGGNVLVNAIGSLVSSGQIIAKGLVDRGGEVRLAQAQNVLLQAGSRIDASGNTQGGSVYAESANAIKVEGSVDASSANGAGGSIELAAGTQAALNNASLDASGANRGGSIYISAKQANHTSLADPNNPINDPTAPPQDRPNVAVTGTTVLRSSARSGKGGKVELTGDDILLGTGSLIDATGATGGGEVLVGGDWQGSNGVYQAVTVNLENGAKIDASATQQGDGGKVVLWSDIHNPNSHTSVAGSIKAEAADGGQGGKVETSGHKLSIADSVSVKTGGGSWLLDPYDFTIGAGGDITASALELALGSGNVSITTQTTGTNTSSAYYGSISGSGDIIIKDALTWSHNTLSLTANHSILVNNTVSVTGDAGLTTLTNQGSYSDTSTTSAGYLKMKQNRSGMNGTDTFDGKITWTSTGTLTMNSKAYSLTGDGDATGKIITTQAELEAISVGNTTLSATTRYYAIANDLTLTGTWAGLGTTTTGFRGTLEGLGHTISGITNSSSVTESYQGFIRQGAVVNIQNLGFVGATIYSGGNTAGILAGSLTDATVRNVFTDTTSRVIDTHTTGGGAFVGGIIGALGAGVALTAVNTIVDSYNGASISMPSGTGYISISGGVVGYAPSGYDSRSYILKNLYNLGSITPYGATPNATWTNIDLGHSAGGVVGYIDHNTTSNASVVANLKNYGAINGSAHVGGVIGQVYVNTNGTAEFHAERLSNFGNINATYDAGGVFGSASGNYPNNYMVVKSASNSGNVTTYSSAWVSTNTGAGGIIGVERFNYKDGGKYFALDTAYNSGTITGAMIAGGIIGCAQGQFDSVYSTSNYYGSTLLSNVYNTGAVYSSASANTGLNSAGGIVGYAQNMYFVGNSSYSGNSGYGIYNAYNSGVITAAYTDTGVADAVGSIIGRYMAYNDSTAPTFANVYSVTGKVSNDNLIGYRSYNAGGNSIRDITSLTGITNKSAATLQSDTLATLGFSASGKWAGGNGTTPYLLGFTTPLSWSLSTISSGYTYNGSAVTLTSLWSASSIFGAGYSSWVLGTDYEFKYGGSTVAGFTNAGTYSSITVNILNNSYSSSGGTAGSLYIAPLAVTLSGTKVYDGNATTSGGSLSVTNKALVGDVVNITNAGTAGIASRNVGTENLTNMTGLSLDNSNYTLTGATGSITVSARPITISTSNVTKTYDAGLTASGTAVASGGTTLGTSDTLSGGTFAFTDVNAGSANKTVTVSGVTVNDGNSGNNYTVTYASNTTSTINKATLTVSGTKVYDGNANMLSYLTLGGLVNGETLGYSAATANSSQVSANGSNYVSSITLTDGTGQASNYQIPASYNASTNSITITARPINVTVDAKTKVYGEANPSLTYALEANGTNRGLVGSDTFSGGLTTAATSSSNVGSYDVTQGTLANGNYAITLVSGTNALSVTARPITLTATAASKIYGDNDPSLAMTANTTSTGAGLASGDTLAEVTGTLTREAGNNAGIYDIALGSGAKAGNYTITFTTDNNAFIINRRPVTVTAAAQSKIYGDTDPTLTYTTNSGTAGSGTGLMSGDLLTGTLTRVAGETVAGGPYQIEQGTVSNANNGNYNITYASANLTIGTRTLTLSGSNGVTKVYDGSTSMLVGTTGYGTLSNIVSGDDVYIAGAPVFNSATVAGANSVLIGSVALAGTTAGNYSLTWTNGTGASITRAPLSVSVNNDAKFVTQSDASGYNGVSYSGFVNGETSSVLTTAPTISRSSSSQNGAGSYTGVLAASGAAAANYSISYVSGDYTIVPAGSLLVTVQNISSTYGAGPSYTITSAKYMDGSNVIHTLAAPTQSGDTYTYSDGVGGSAVFTLAPVAAQNSTAGLLRAGNYDIGATNITETSNNFSNNLVVVGALTVNQKALSANASNVSKVYDGSTAMNNVVLGYTGLETNDTVTIAGNGSFSNKNVGTNLNYTISSLTLARIFHAIA